MCRKDLLVDITSTLKDLGFVESSTKTAMTFESNVRYPSMFTDKSDYAHFILYTPKRTIQIVVKFQESNGTAIEKLAYTAMDAARTEHDSYVVVCGGIELLKSGRAIDFLNDKKYMAPRLHALRASELRDFLSDDLKPLAA